MVFPNFFITFVRHSFHTSPPLHIPPSRARGHRPAPHLPPGTTLPSWHTRCLTRHAHALHIAKGYAHAPRTRHASSSLTAHTPPHYNPRKGLCHTRCSPSQHTRPPHYNPRKGLCHAHASRAKMPQCFPLQPPLF